MALQDLSVLNQREVEQKYPLLKEYKACQSRAFMKGFIGIIGGGGLGIGIAKVLQQYNPIFPAKYNIAFATGVSVFCGYMASSHASTKCQRLYTEAEWRRMAEEERLKRFSDEEYVKSLSDPETNAFKEDYNNLARTKYGDKME